MAFLTCLQVTWVAIECSAEKSSQYIARISEYRPDQLVFVDESSVDRRTSYRGTAWSFQSTQAQQKAFFVCGRQYVLFLPLYRSWKSQIINKGFQSFWPSHWVVSFIVTSLKAPTASKASLVLLIAFLTIWSHIPPTTLLLLWIIFAFTNTLKSCK
jgi:hypothetical protein